MQTHSSPVAPHESPNVLRWAEGLAARQASNFTAADIRARHMRWHLLMIVGIEVAVFCVEAVTFVAQQIAWPGDKNFLCDVAQHDKELTDVHDHASYPNVSVISFLLAAHCFRAFQCLYAPYPQPSPPTPTHPPSTMPDGARPQQIEARRPRRMLVATAGGLLPHWIAHPSRMRERTSVHALLSEALVWVLLVTLTALTLSEAAYECIDSLSWQSVLVRLHSAVHLGRVLLSAHACFVLRQDARSLMQVAVSGNKV
jgi:hypothetical protein